MAARRRGRVPDRPTRRRSRCSALRSPRRSEVGQREQRSERDRGCGGEHRVEAGKAESWSWRTSGSWPRGVRGAVIVSVRGSRVVGCRVDLRSNPGLTTSPARRASVLAGANRRRSATPVAALGRGPSGPAGRRRRGRDCRRRVPSVGAHARDVLVRRRRPVRASGCTAGDGTGRGGDLRADATARGRGLRTRRVAGADPVCVCEHRPACAGDAVAQRAGLRPRCAGDHARRAGVAHRFRPEPAVRVDLHRRPVGAGRRASGGA